MRKVVSGSLKGNAYQFEEHAYEAVNRYLADAAAQLAANPDRAEILADLEQAVADKCDSFLGRHKNVISVEEAAQIIHEMGPVQGAPSADAAAGSTAWSQSAPDDAVGVEDTARFAQGPDIAQMAGAASSRKRLLRLPSEGMMGGVCAGFAAYFDIDVVWVRLAFVLITIFTWTAWILVWLAMLIVMPAARTPEQMASARGEALSARDVMEMAKRKSADIAKAATAAARDAERNLRDTFGPR